MTMGVVIWGGQMMDTYRESTGKEPSLDDANGDDGFVAFLAASGIPIGKLKSRLEAGQLAVYLLRRKDTP
jgi:hypothetical protein